jgi:hypothetical protein
MIDPYVGYRGREDAVVIPRIRVAVALSILVHAAALWVFLPRLPLLSPGQERDQASERLQIVLNAPPIPAPESPPAPPPPRRETRAILTARPRPRNAPPRETPPEFVVPVPQAPEAPPPPPLAEAPKTYPPVEGDLASYIEARRRARGELSASTSPSESEIERRNRIVAANMPASQSPMAGQVRKRGGGLFEITRMAYDDAEFRFFGFHPESARKLPQMFEVRLGNNSDMRIAIVRRMIALIRETEHGDINWDSYRLGRIVELSARPEDNAALEEFMMQEFFNVNESIH